MTTNHTHIVLPIEDKTTTYECLDKGSSIRARLLVNTK